MQNKENLAASIGDILSKKNKTVAIAESCTGGLISKLLTDISGCSKYISLNVVTYSNEAKVKILNVQQDTLNKFGVVSEQIAKEMAIGIKNLSGSDFGLGITGIAGPTGGTFEKQVGLVYVGLTNGIKTIAEKLTFQEELPREEIRAKAAEKALNLLKDFIQKN